MKRTIFLLSVTCVFLQVAAAQTATDTFRVNYFSSLQGGASFSPQPSYGTYSNGNAYNTPTVSGATTADETVSIVNPGTDGIVPGTSTGDLCALIYVVDTAEELQECCGCLVTPDQLIELSVQNDLDSNPHNGVVVHSGAIKIISSAPTGAAASEYDDSVCNPGAPNPTPALREWITHTRLINSTTRVTETPFSEATLSTGGAGSELAFLGAQCTNIRTQGTGSGLCNCPAPNYGFSTTFSYTGGMQTFTVPGSGTYHIVAAGAQGGDATAQGGAAAGLGAEIAGDFTLTAGQVLNVAVGQGASCQTYGCGGGGGTFVVLTGSTPTPLAIAGGGGGAFNTPGGPGQAGQAGGNAGVSRLAPFPAGGMGGTNGAGGQGGTAVSPFPGGGGGAGFFSDGSPGTDATPLLGGGGGTAYPTLTGGTGGYAGARGGYGGGGGAGAAGGGGGGYSGGGGGAAFGPGGGGGSFNSGANQANTAGTNSGNGFVTITYVHP